MLLGKLTYPRLNNLSAKILLRKFLACILSPLQAKTNSFRSAFHLFSTLYCQFPFTRVWQKQQNIHCLSSTQKQGFFKTCSL
jgi:hypothetical protein